jgi:hypothetical protein
MTFPNHGVPDANAADAPIARENGCDILERRGINLGVRQARQLRLWAREEDVYVGQPWDPSQVRKKRRGDCLVRMLG